MDVLALIGVVFGGIAAVGGVIAAIYSIVTWAQGRSSQETANQRWRMEIEPRVRVDTIRTGSDGLPAIVRVLNAGGAAPASLLAIRAGNAVFVGGSAVPGAGNAQFRVQAMATINALEPEQRPVVIAARDIEGNWWNCMNGTRTGDFVPWWNAQLDNLGIPRIPLEVSPDGLSLHAVPAAAPQRG